MSETVLTDGAKSNKLLEGRRMSKFIQISTCTDSNMQEISVMALDDKGHVWYYDWREMGWYPITSERKQGLYEQT